MKILVVDDVPMYVELLREPLAEAGYEPVVATSAAEAREALARHQPRLVFLDLHMPGEPGDALCRAITSAGGAAPAVVMMGVAGRDEDRRRCEAAGCHVFLPKPIRPAVAVATAARFLEVGERQPRVALRVPVVCRADGVRRVVQATNLSTGGLSVTTARPFAPGTRLVVEFRLPLDAAEAPLSTEAEVRWSVGADLARVGVEPGMGLRFLAVEPSTQAAIDRFIRRSLAAARVGAIRFAAPGPRPGP